MFVCGSGVPSQNDPIWVIEGAPQVRYPGTAVVVVGDDAVAGVVRGGVEGGSEFGADDKAAVAVELKGCVDGRIGVVVGCTREHCSTPLTFERLTPPTQLQ